MVDRSPRKRGSVCADPTDRPAKPADGSGWFTECRRDWARNRANGALASSGGRLRWYSELQAAIGLPYPFVLAACRRWRIFAAASLTSAALITAAVFLFGFATWISFLQFMFRQLQSTEFFQPKPEFAGAQQSISGLITWLGFSRTAAWTVQAAVTAAAVAGTVALWRSTAPFAEKGELRLRSALR